jgi:hypothetical protein
MDTYNFRKAQEIAVRLVVTTDEIISILRALEKGARDLRRAASKAR